MQHSIFGLTVSTIPAHVNETVSDLPEAIHSGLAFFEACLEEKVIVVPGTINVLHLLTVRRGVF